MNPRQRQPRGAGSILKSKLIRPRNLLISNRRGPRPSSDADLGLSRGAPLGRGAGPQGQAVGGWIAALSAFSCSADSEV